MPCVCLVNTFARWQSAKTEKNVSGKVALIKLKQLTNHQIALGRRQLRPLFSRKNHPRSKTPKNHVITSQKYHSKTAGLLTESTIVRVPHARKPFSKAKAPVSLSGVTEPIFLRKSSSLARLAANYTSHPSVRMTRADLINAESKLGSTIFGPIPAGHRREFFHDQNNVWIWHEDWYDGQNNPHQMTVRYEVRTTGIYKKVSAGKYLKLEGDELENFRKATHAYLDVIKKNLYNRPKLAQIS